MNRSLGVSGVMSVQAPARAVSDRRFGSYGLLCVLALTLTLGACASGQGPARSAKSSTGAGDAAQGAGSGGTMSPGGRYYLDDGPGDGPPPDLDAIADAVPRAEPIRPSNSRPYVVFGRQYRPMSQLEPYQARGVATWYGRRYHGNPTSSGERYDMYAMTAAHPTLPIPSYVRVRNLANGKTVVVRVNDRGPFLNDRLIDLSYTAAAKLGYVDAGSAEVEVELITQFGEPPATVVAVATAATSAPAAPAAPAAAPERLSVETEIREPAPIAATATPTTTTTTASTAAAADARAVPTLDRGFWLQLGAFGSADNASAARERVVRQVTGLGAALDVVADGGMYKLQAGPWPTREAAQAAAEIVRASTELRPFTTQR